MRRMLVGLAMFGIAVAAPCLALADDHEIAQQIAQQLRAQKEVGRLKGFGIDLMVDQGTVWLKGQVSSADQQKLALDIARRTEGVKQVVNGLEVSPPNDPAPLVHADTSAPIASPAEKVATAETAVPLLREPATRGEAATTGAATEMALTPARQEAESKGAEPTRSAATESAATESAATEPVATEPVATEPASSASDDALARTIMAQLKELKEAGKLKGFSLQVKPKQGQVWMIGRVSSEEQRMLVLNTAAHVPGVRQVVNAVRVESSSAETADSTGPKVEATERTPTAGRTATPAPQQKSSRRGLLSSLFGGGKEPAKAERETRPTLADSTQKPEPNRRKPEPNLRKPEPAQVATLSPAREPVKKAAPLEMLAEASPIPADDGEQPVGTAVKKSRSVMRASESRPASPRQVQLVGAQRSAAQGSMAAAPTGPAATPIRPGVPYRTAQRVTPVPFAPSHLGAGGGGQVRAMPISNQTLGPHGPAMGPAPAPMHLSGPAYGGPAARYDHPSLPGYAWPSYASYPNYAAVTYPQQYSPTAWPYIGPFYPYPQVPLGWRKVTLEWDDGWWMLDFKSK